MVYSDSEEYDNNEMTEIISESCSFLELKPEEAREVSIQYTKLLFN